jgi:hypothetical protein
MKKIISLLFFSTLLIIGFSFLSPLNAAGPTTYDCIVSGVCTPNTLTGCTSTSCSIPSPNACSGVLNNTCPNVVDQPCDCTAQCSAPTNLTQSFSCHSNGTTASAHFGWNQVSGTSLYRFQIDTDNQFPSPIQTSHTANNFVDIPSLTANTAYYWRVQVEANSSCTPDPNVWAIYGPPLNVTCNPPGNQCSAPTGLNHSYTCPDSDANITLSWQAVTGAGTYHVQLDNDTGFGSPVWQVLNTTNTSETATNIPQGSYYWRVWVDSSSFCTVPGAYSHYPFIAVTCGLPAPPPPPGNGGITIPPIDFDLLQGIASPNFPGGTTIGNIIAASFIYLFAGAGLILTIFILYGGFTLMLSRGDPGAVAKGKAILSAALIGLVVVITAFWIVQLIGEFLDIQAIKNIF